MYMLHSTRLPQLHQYNNMVTDDVAISQPVVYPLINPSPAAPLTPPTRLIVSV